jgi:hypothetical protein
VHAQHFFCIFVYTLGGKPRGRGVVAMQQFPSASCFYGNFNTAKFFNIMGKKGKTLASLLLVEALQK